MCVYIEGESNVRRQSDGGHLRAPGAHSGRGSPYDLSLNPWRGGGQGFGDPESVTCCVFGWPYALPPRLVPEMSVPLVPQCCTKSHDRNR